jgi:hypothetical protein
VHRRRYIHVPLGGAKRVVLSTLLVFSFVALWHDLSMTLLAWGWLVSAFVLPELAARRALPATQVSPRVRPPTNVRVGWLTRARQFGGRWWYRHVAAAGAVGNILMMMGANLVGFVVGLDGTRELAQKLLGSAAGAWLSAGAVALGVMLRWGTRTAVHGVCERVLVDRRAVHVRVPVRAARLGTCGALTARKRGGAPPGHIPAVLDRMLVGTCGGIRERMYICAIRTLHTLSSPLQRKPF